MRALREYVKDKSVAIIGNAKSILYSRKDIDKHDIVVRINHADPKGYEAYMGSRTDIWVTGVSQRKAAEAYKALRFRFIVLTHVGWTPQMIDPESNFIIYEYPVLSQARLKDKMREMGDGSHTSTGLRTIDMFVEFNNYKDLNIYGFDFFITEDITSNSFHRGDRLCYDIEKKIVDEFLFNDKRISFIKDTKGEA